jgi:pyrroline-5-carboxylate reductase
MKIGVVGCGEIGSIIAEKLGENHEVTGYDREMDKLEGISNLENRKTDLEDLKEEVVFLCVRPDQVLDVLEQTSLLGNQKLVSVAAGVKLHRLGELTDAEVARMMTNTAAEYGEAASTITFSSSFSGKEKVRNLAEELGEKVETAEKFMDLSTALNGSGPAFVYYMIKAFKQKAVEEGMRKQDAEKLSAQTFKGAAEKTLQSDKTLHEMIDEVCSEGGTTVEGMKDLRGSDVERTVMDSLDSSEERASEISEQLG